jgi:hypothetical protein
MIRPTHTCVVDGGMSREVVDEHVREVEVVTTLDDAVAREGQDAGSPAAQERSRESSPTPSANQSVEPAARRAARVPRDNWSSRGISRG